MIPAWVFPKISQKHSHSFSWVCEIGNWKQNCHAHDTGKSAARDGTRYSGSINTGIWGQSATSFALKDCSYMYFPQNIKNSAFQKWFQLGYFLKYPKKTHTHFRGWCEIGNWKQNCLVSSTHLNKSLRIRALRLIIHTNEKNPLFPLCCTWRKSPNIRCYWGSLKSHLLTAAGSSF